MTAKTINYYGYDKNTYYDCIDQIHSTNKKHFEILNIWFIFMNILFAIFSVSNVFGVDKRSTRYYIAYLLFAIVLEVGLFIFKQTIEKHSLALVYVNIITFLSFAVSSSISQAYLPATMFLVMVVLVALSYIDTLFRMSLVIIISSFLFIWSSFGKKPSSIAYQDMYNVTIFLSLAIILHYTFQRARMQQFITYQKNLQIKRELEVKSSFDALTSLLNRGRFFSMAGEVLRQGHNEYMVICLLDLDSFKQINDKLGHQMGDKAIQIAGTTILETLEIDLSEKWSFPEKAVEEKLCFAGRLGGDEFIVLMRGAKGKDEIVSVLQQMLTSLNNVNFGELHGIHASFGVTEIDVSETDIDKAYSRADEALYQSKRAGKNQITFNNK